MAFIAKSFAQHPGKTSLLCIIGLVVFVMLWLVAFNFARNSIDGCSTKMHSKWMHSLNPSHLPWFNVSVIPSFENIGSCGKANASLTGQAILAEDATRQEDRLLAATPTGSLA